MAAQPVGARQSVGGVDAAGDELSDDGDQDDLVVASLVGDSLSGGCEVGLGVVAEGPAEHRVDGDHLLAFGASAVVGTGFGAGSSCLEPRRVVDHLGVVVVRHRLQRLQVERLE